MPLDGYFPGRNSYTGYPGTRVPVPPGYPYPGTAIPSTVFNVDLEWLGVLALQSQKKIHKFELSGSPNIGVGAAYPGRSPPGYPCRDIVAVPERSLPAVLLK
eukprot:842089-Rhodomonas_salina.1